MVLRNTRSTTPIPINGVFSTELGLPSALTISWVEVKLATMGALFRGSVLFTADLGDGGLATAGSNGEDIRDNGYFRVRLPGPVSSDRIKIRIEVQESSEGRLAIWANPSGICFRAGTEEEIEVNLEKPPLISIITPVYKTPLEYLIKAIGSVRDQTYTNWELILVDDFSEDSGLRSILSGLSMDSRIKVSFRSRNGGISACSNEGLSMASGDWVCFLDHDDEMHKDALLEIAKTADCNPWAHLIYTDEDKISDTGERSDPHFKPGWSRTLLARSMYTCHLSAYRRDLLLSVGGFRAGFEGSQDHDLALRYTEWYDRVIHIPKVLYHWRVHSNSTSSGGWVKPEARLSGLRAVSDHFSRIGCDVRVTSSIVPHGTYRVEYLLPIPPAVELIIPTRDQLQALKTCLFSLRNSTYPKMKIRIIDNGSVDKETVQFLSDIPDGFRRPGTSIEVNRYDSEFNFSSIVNYGRSLSDSEYLCLLNDDTEAVSTSWLEQMVGLAEEDQRVGVVGAKLLYPSGHLQHAGMLMGYGGVAGHCHKGLPGHLPGYFGRPHTTHEVSGVTAACMLVKNAVWDECGGFEEGLPRAFNDVDFCLKAREKGYSIVYSAESVLIHHESISRGSDSASDPTFQAAVEFMISKWGTHRMVDPFWNPNFSRSSQIYEAL